ncbi:MAG: HAD-IIA family hydrolase [Anaerolineaceae bacterium]|nr:HAD-IIA family hydrolase [Anaerolineaceae bacterium]
MDLCDIRGVVSDMDGVLWRGDVPLPGLVPFFSLLRERELPWVLATNNSSKSRQDYVRKLAAMGVPDVPTRNIVTSGTATAAWLRRRYEAGTRLHVFGGDGLRDELRNAGFCVADSDVVAVVAGLNRNFNYQDLQLASDLIRNGACFVGTNPDTTFPAANGVAPGAGSLLAALAAASGVEPRIIGKPHPPMFEAALELLGTDASQTLMIGDRMNTDILGAARVGMRTALIMTGIASHDGLDDNAPEPDLICESLPALIATLAPGWMNSSTRPAS